MAIPTNRHTVYRSGYSNRRQACYESPGEEEYGFEGGPFLGFPASHDVYGDGSIVVVPAFGHTPGSVIIFVTLPSGTRYAFVGDIVWQLEGITQREERPGSLAEEPIRMQRLTA